MQNYVKKINLRLFLKKIALAIESSKLKVKKEALASFKIK
jgi:hypothetical protein